MSNIVHPYTINWHGPCNAELGYCRHNREMIMALQRQGITINLSTSDGKKPNYKWFWNGLFRPHKPELITIFCTPQTWIFPRYGYGILFTTIESYTLHSAAVHRSQCFQELWVPSQFNYQVFKKYKFKNIHIIPEGIDPEFWNVEHEGIDNTFRFITLADWSFRKGIHALIKSFYLAFKNERDVKLLFLTRKAAHEGTKYTREIIKEATDHVKDVGGNLDKIEFITTILSDKEIRTYFKTSDCFVLPTLGEAWCLPAEEAMGCELPCILPKIGGHRDFASEKTGWLTSGRWRTMPKSDVLFYNDQLFYHPDIKSLVKAMRYAYAHPIECRKKGEYARKLVTTKWTWDNAAKIAARRIGEIYLQGYNPERRGKCLM